MFYSEIQRFLLSLAQQEFENALVTAEAWLAEEPESVDALTNKAVCFMYLGRLRDAVALLEGALEQKPLVYASEPIVFNLVRYFLPLNHNLLLPVVMYTRRPCTSLRITIARTASVLCSSA